MINKSLLLLAGVIVFMNNSVCGMEDNNINKRFDNLAQKTDGGLNTSHSSPDNNPSIREDFPNKSDEEDAPLADMENEDMDDIYKTEEIDLGRTCALMKDLEMDVNEIIDSDGFQDTVLTIEYIMQSCKDVISAVKRQKNDQLNEALFEIIARMAESKNQYLQKLSVDIKTWSTFIEINGGQQ